MYKVKKFTTSPTAREGERGVTKAPLVGFYPRLCWYTGFEGQRSAMYIRLLPSVALVVSVAEKMNRGRAVIQLSQTPLRRFVEGKSTPQKSLLTH